ncbi:flagellar biosynthesis protein FlhF [Geobacter sp. DSM 9736]|uniref:flagellar biosynthesis protein FlhF n=1 Tax=Geobacter sp. DSM 9736 TaxID=1277350 RepID=UPI000B6079D5|nr:flagellar biosynthesis protein FlhF [Geobacter sp. DSM 9736]
MIKVEMGADAMILSSKKERRPGILGFFTKPVFEVTAALETKPAPRPNPYQEREEKMLSTREEFQNSMLGPIARELKALREKVDNLMNKPPEQPDFQAQAARAPAEPAAEKPVSMKNLPKEDMEELKKFLLNAVVAREKTAPAPYVFPRGDEAKEKIAVSAEQREDDSLISLTELSEELRSCGIEEEGVEILLEYIKPAAEQGEEKDELRYSLLEAFANLVKCTGPIKTKKGKPRVIALVGPTGVGKTTTTAKLAAMYAINKGANVALITTDNFRVGAFEQLKTYSKIMGVPLEIASSPKEMTKAIESHSDKDLIFIDTAGRSPKDQEKLDELKAFLESSPAIETHLCLAATTKDKDLYEIVKRFGILPISRLLFTKLDESESLGGIINAHMRSKLPLSYLTNGQMVPEDIVVATPRKLANLVMRENG